MPKDEWGVKRVCPTTGKRFYDLGRDPIVSPYTGEAVILETGKGGAQSLVADKSAKRAKETASEDEEELVLDDDDLEIDDDDADAEIDEDDVLDDDDDEDTVALDDLAEVAAEGSDDD